MTTALLTEEEMVALRDVEPVDPIWAERRTDFVEPDDAVEANIRAVQERLNRSMVRTRELIIRSDAVAMQTGKLIAQLRFSAAKLRQTLERTRF